MGVFQTDGSSINAQERKAVTVLCFILCSCSLLIVTSAQDEFAAVEDEKKFEEGMVTEHNNKRKIHGVPDIQLSRELCDEEAKGWAAEMARKDQLEIKPKSRYGQIESSVWSDDPNYVVTAADVVKHWYEDNEYYDYDKEPSKGYTFAQMVWKATKEMGVAAAKSKSNKIYVVAFYKPTGNVLGQFIENVLRPK